MEDSVGDGYQQVFKFCIFYDKKGSSNQVPVHWQPEAKISVSKSYADTRVSAAEEMDG